MSEVDIINLKMQRQYRSGIFTVDFYCNSHLFFVLTLLTLTRQTFTGYLFYRCKVCSLKLASLIESDLREIDCKKWKSYRISQSFEKIFLE